MPRQPRGSIGQRAHMGGLMSYLGGLFGGGQTTGGQYTPAITPEQHDEAARKTYTPSDDEDAQIDSWNNAMANAPAVRAASISPMTVTNHFADFLTGNKGQASANAFNSQIPFMQYQADQAQIMAQKQAEAAMARTQAEAAAGIERTKLGEEGATARNDSQYTGMPSFGNADPTVRGNLVRGYQANTGTQADFTASPTGQEYSRLNVMGRQLGPLGQAQANLRIPEGNYQPSFPGLGGYQVPHGYPTETQSLVPETIPNPKGGAPIVIGNKLTTSRGYNQSVAKPIPPPPTRDQLDAIQQGIHKTGPDSMDNTGPVVPDEQTARKVPLTNSLRMPVGNVKSIGNNTFQSSSPALQFPPVETPPPVDIGSFIQAYLNQIRNKVNY